MSLFKSREELDWTVGCVANTIVSEEGFANRLLRCGTKVRRLGEAYFEEAFRRSGLGSPKIKFKNDRERQKAVYELVLVRARNMLLPKGVSLLEEREVESLKSNLCTPATPTSSIKGELLNMDLSELETRCGALYAHTHKYSVVEDKTGQQLSDSELRARAKTSRYIATYDRGPAPISFPNSTEEFREEMYEKMLDKDRTYKVPEDGKLITVTKRETKMHNVKVTQPTVVGTVNLSTTTSAQLVAMVRELKAENAKNEDMQEFSKKYQVRAKEVDKAIEAIIEELDLDDRDADAAPVAPAPVAPPLF